MEGIRIAILAVLLAVGALFGATGALADEPTTAVVYQTEVVDTVDAAASVPPEAANPLEDVDLEPTLAAWQIILGVMASVITAVVNRAIPGITPDDSLKRGVMTAVMCVLVAAADVLVRGVFTGSNLLASLVFVFSGAVGFYTLWFKNSTIPARIEGKAV